MESKSWATCTIICRPWRITNRSRSNRAKCSVTLGRVAPTRLAMSLWLKTTRNSVPRDSSIPKSEHSSSNAMAIRSCGPRFRKLERVAQGLAPSRSKDIDRATTRQHQQPCAHVSTLGIEAGRVPPGLGVHFDHRIFRGGAVPKNAHGEPKDPPAAGVVQLRHRRLVSASRPLDEPVPGFLAGRRRWSTLWHAAKN